jgi:hypothetical protein
VCDRACQSERQPTDKRSISLYKYPYSSTGIIHNKLLILNVVAARSHCAPMGDRALCSRPRREPITAFRLSAGGSLKKKIEEWKVPYSYTSESRNLL